MRIEKKTRLIIFLVTFLFVVGILPWLLLIFEQTKESVKWLKEIYFQFWGWFLLLCLAIYALKEVFSWNITSKFIKITSMVFILIMLVWSLTWLSLIVFGYVIITIA
jgi:hypothetical protein